MWKVLLTCLVVAHGDLSSACQTVGKGTYRLILPGNMIQTGRPAHKIGHRPSPRHWSYDCGENIRLSGLRKSVLLGTGLAVPRDVCISGMLVPI